MTQQKFSCYQCDEDSCNVLAEELSVCEDAIYCWKSTVRDDNGKEQNARGCITKVEHVRLVCSSRMQMSDSRFRSACCTENFCNNGTFPILEAAENLIDVEQGMSATKLTLTILVPLITVGIIIIALYYRCYQKSRMSQKKNKNHQQAQQHIRSDSIEKPGLNLSNDSTSSSSPDLKIPTVSNIIVEEYLRCPSLSSSSSTDRPLPVKPTLSKQISLVECLNEGSFGQQPKLWRGSWLGENVAVKVYSSRSEAMWTNETEVYEKLRILKHDNILEYVASERISVMNGTQLWLVTHYHPNGSLRNYLKGITLSQKMMFKGCLSLARGLLYLHTEIQGPKKKLSMAHCNLSSNNVYVKNDGACAIGGLEHAVTLESLDEASFLEHASKRYMSPELLDTTFEHGIWSLEGFQQADIYSMSLVLWEICRRCVSNKDIVLDYEIPFSEFLTNSECEPTAEEMRKLIIVDERRPEIPSHWHSDPIMTEIGTMIQECWHKKASVRWPIVQVKKMFVKLANN